MRMVKRVAMATLVFSIVLSLGSCLWFLAMGNKATLGDGEFDIERAIVGELDAEGDVHFVGLFFLGEGVGFTEGDGFSGQGSIIFLGILSSASGLVEGTYPYDYEAMEPNALVTGELAINADLDEYTEPDIAGLLDPPDSSGSMSIAEVTVGDWLVEWDLVVMNDLAEGTLPCTGKYRGEFEVMDMSEVFSQISIVN